VAVRRKRTTLRQVAERAGVSPTTASFVINEVEGSNISAETKARVVDAAAELGYMPSAAAQSLVSGRSRTIGLVIYQADLLLVDAFIPQLLFGLNRVARAKGYHVQVEGVDQLGGDDPYQRMVQAQGLDGLIVLDPRSSDPGLGRLIRSGFPVVTLGHVPNEDPYRVVSENVVGMFDATRHLLTLGHERIAHLTFSPRGFTGTDERLEGYRRALEEAGIAVDEELVEETGYSAASGAEAMRRLLERTQSFTAVTCGNDTVAVGAMAALREVGLRIPEDVSVVGFDDLPFAAHLHPPLSTVRTLPVASGERAMDVLLCLIDGKEPEARVVRMETSLVVRASSAPPATST